MILTKERIRCVIVAICKSERKGTRKFPVDFGILRENYGLIGDTHASSDTHRQVSLLSTRSIEKMRKPGLDVGPGDFAENLTVEGLDSSSLSIGMKLKIGDEVILEIKEIGKECHVGCTIFREVGKCIMPEEGIFARVIKERRIKPGDQILLINSKTCGIDNSRGEDKVTS